MTNHTPNCRIGHGYDLHRLATVASGGRPLALGGVVLDSQFGPVAHSDGDALLHAITDAILGAVGLPDIGQLFPDSEPRWAGARSDQFLVEAVRRAREAGWTVGNVDATVILERPKIGSRKDEIRQSIARILGVDPASVNIKGKTHEGVDAVGEGRAVEVHAVVLIVRADS
ncbi:MAG: 2-C-methyl-D-erythritol 2,4-cyclodiphosphate synthase [Phycisphaerales bacterium]